MHVQASSPHFGNARLSLLFANNKTNKELLTQLGDCANRWQDTRWTTPRNEDGSPGKPYKRGIKQITHIELQALFKLVEPTLQKLYERFGIQMPDANSQEQVSIFVQPGSRSLLYPQAKKTGHTVAPRRGAMRPFDLVYIQAPPEGEDYTTPNRKNAEARASADLASAIAESRTRQVEVILGLPISHREINALNRMRGN
jgi:hypothetical protein